MDQWLKESTVYDATAKGLDAIGTFILEWPELVAFEAGCLALAILMAWWMRFSKRSPTTQGEEDEMRRMVQLESTYADKIGDFMLDMLVSGEITRKEYKRDCKRFGVAFRLSDLLRPVRSKIGIKYRIIRNVKNNHATLPFIQASKIPGPKPGKDVPVQPSKPIRRVWVAVGKRRSAA